MSQELADSTSSMTIDDDGWFDIGSDHNLMFWESNDSYKMEQRSGEEASSLKGQCRDSLWAWKTNGKVDWAGYKIKVLNKSDFRDAMCLRFGFPLDGVSSTCVTCVAMP